MDAVVEGTVLRFGDRVRITAQLIEASTHKHLWSPSYEGELRDTLALQSKVAGAIADQIRINVNPQEQAALKTVRVVNPQAYESYLKGRYFWNKAHGGWFEDCPSLFQSGHPGGAELRPSLFWLSRHVCFVETGSMRR